MPRRRVKQNLCPSCGEPAKEPYKTWELTAPLPDSEMRITITVMGMFECSKCGKKFKGVVSKLKVGEEKIEFEK
ncbi:MAG: chromatin protein Cren7 [Candidatus Bathyarchaeia archaeon]